MTPTLDQMREALRIHLRDGIPVDDYLNGLYNAEPISDFENDRCHEVRGHYSATGNPIVCNID
jgi:hypothetical protein